MNFFRLQIGASRLERLTENALKVFLNKNWTHLGDQYLSNPNDKPLSKVDYSKTNFLPFYFRTGDKLPFEDESFTHIFTEHFLEHIFFDQSIEILKECFRILCPGGFIRIVVPDADLRPTPEMVGFPGNHFSYDDPQKHKTRWSIHLLEPALEIAKLKPVPIRFYDCKGFLHDNLDSLPLSNHGFCIDQEMIYEVSHIQRPRSLIVDGVKNA